MTETVLEQSPVVAPPKRQVGFFVRASLLALLIVAAIYPTLTWLEFSNAPEALNVGTAQEMHRTGQWFVPTLQGKTRLAKPPLTAWITATTVTDRTMRDISDHDQAVRDRGFIRLAFETRWPLLVAGLVVLLLTAELGRLIAGDACGIASLVIAGSSLMFLRYIRYSATDVQLMLWVAAANVFMAHALLRGRCWAGCLGAGITLGLAMMSKGPAALAQSVAPLAVWLLWDRARRREARWPGIGPLLSGIALFLAVGTSWFLMVYFSENRALTIWLSEITREGARDAAADPWYSYLSLIPLMLPWAVFLILGFAAPLLKRDDRSMLPVLMVIVPILIMSLARDKTERYLLPILPAASVVAAIGWAAFRNLGVARAIHWAIVAIFAIAFPIAALLFDPPWITFPIGALILIGAALLVCVGLAVQRASPAALIYTTLLLMLGLQILFIWGYRTTRSGSAELRPLAETIASEYPAAVVWNVRPADKRPPPELGIYLNRVIQWTDSISKIEAGETPQIALLHQNQGLPDLAAPASWQFIGAYPRDSDTWWAFVLPPR